MAEKEIWKQIGEKFVVANDFSPKLPTNTALLSGILLVTRLGKTETTTLSAAVIPGATTIQLAHDVKAGAALVLNDTLGNEEPVLVRSVSGSSAPFTATLASAIQLNHASGDVVKYERGDSDLVLASQIATVSGTYLGANLIGGLVYKYRLTFIATITNNQIIRDDVTLIIHE